LEEEPVRDPFIAIDAATDLGAHARRLRRAWEGSVVGELDRLDVMIANAGIAHVATLLEVTPRGVRQPDGDQPARRVPIDGGVRFA
jgi:hypothetical protein